MSERCPYCGDPSSYMYIDQEFERVKGSNKLKSIDYAHCSCCGISETEEDIFDPIEEGYTEEDIKRLLGGE